MKGLFYFCIKKNKMTIENIYKIFLKHNNIITDSRKITGNSIFWALKGENFNGNKFAEDALKKGAAYAVIDDENYYYGDKTILVKDTLKTLQQLANYHRKQLNLPIIVITGTNGKTTTKELIYKIISTQINAGTTKGNFNNHIGLPLTLLSFNKNTEIGIVEAGANHPGEINQLCEIAEPDFGLITNIGKAHLEGFGSFEGVIKTKEELYKYIIKNNGTVFYNSGNEILSSLYKGEKKVSYGTNPDDYLKGKILPSEKYLNLEIETFEGLKTEINSNLTGNYNFENILAAACIGSFFNISIQNIKKAVESYIPDNNRSQHIKTENNEIILDAYNANPTSMQASINNFLNLKNTEKCIILGDMYELGQYSKEEHYNILKLISENLENNSVKKAYVIGKYFKEAFYPDFSASGIKHFENTEQFEIFFKNKNHKNYIFLIKGSRAVQLEKIIKFIK